MSLFFVPAFCSQCEEWAEWLLCQQRGGSLWLLQAECYPHWSCVMWTAMGFLTSSSSSQPWWMPVSWVSTTVPSTPLSVLVSTNLVYSSSAWEEFVPLQIHLVVSFINMASVLWLCFVMLFIIFLASLCSSTCSQPVSHPFPLVSSWGKSISLSCTCAHLAWGQR